MLMKGKIFENFYRKKQILLMVITGIELNIWKTKNKFYSRQIKLFNLLWRRIKLLNYKWSKQSFLFQIIKRKSIELTKLLINKNQCRPSNSNELFKHRALTQLLWPLKIKCFRISPKQRNLQNINFITLSGYGRDNSITRFTNMQWAMAKTRS